VNPVMVAWMVETGIIAIRDLTGPKRLPLPSELLATFIVFGGLALATESPTFRGAANATAWGMVIATALSTRVDFQRPVGEFMSGRGPAATTPTPTHPPVLGAK
jgi:hypothetical protein